MQGSHLLVVTSIDLALAELLNQSGQAGQAFTAGTQDQRCPVCVCVLCVCVRACVCVCVCVHMSTWQSEYASQLHMV